MLNYIEYIKENNTFGYNSFLILLKILDDIDINFIKSNDNNFNYLNSKDYLLFYKTYEIKNKQELLDKLEFRNSLKYAYDKLNLLKDKKNSIFIGINKKVLTYGFYNHTDNNIIKLGECQLSKNILNNILKFKSIFNISKDLNLINISKIFILKEVKNDIENSFYVDKKSKIEIINFDVLKIIFNIKDFEFKEYQKSLNTYISNKKWKDKIDSYFEIDNDNLIFYFKIKRNEEN